MKNLHFKKNALDFLTLPIRVNFGKINSLRIQLNWLSLFSTPVSIILYDLLLVTVLDVDSIKDEKTRAALAHEIKEKALKKLAEEIKSSSDQPSEFNEFLGRLGQIKEIKIENVHIRFEDSFSNSHEPLVAGFTVDRILIQAESSNSNPKYSSFNAENLIYKSLSPYHLSAYWTFVDEEGKNILLSQSGLDGSSIEKKLMDSIASDKRHPENLEYIIRPVSFRTNVMINNRPDLHDFLIPVIDVDLPLGEVTSDDFKLGFTTKQLESFLNLYDFLTQMKKSAPHVENRPSVAVKNNAKIWWKFAINAVLENEVRRKNKLWYSYAYAYKQKLLNPKDETKAKIARSLESSLDVFKIVNTRRLVEASISKVEHMANGSATGVHSESEKEKSENFDWIEYFERGMTNDEIIDFYTTVSEDSDTSGYPKQFVAYALTINIRSVRFFITNTSDDTRLVEFPLQNIKLLLKHRPSSNIWNFVSYVDDISLLNANGKILAAKESNEQAIYFELMVSPVQSTFEFGIRLKTSPLYFIYDPSTVNSLVEMFTHRTTDFPDGPTDDSASNLEEQERLRRISYAALEYAISNRRKLNVNINISTFFFTIPSEDFLKGGLADAIVICPGRVTVISSPRLLKQLSEDSSTDQLIDGSYDLYRLSISEVQIFLTTANDWKEDIRDINRVKPILRPAALNVLLQRSILDDVFNLPKFKVRADVPSIILTLEESQLFNVLSILTKLPLPNLKQEPTASLVLVDTFYSLPGPNNSDEPSDFFKTNFEVQFFIKEILVELTREGLNIIKACGPANNSGDMVNFFITSEAGSGESSSVSSVDLNGFTLILALDSLVKFGMAVTAAIASNLKESTERISDQLKQLATKIALDTTDSMRNFSNSIIKSSSAILMKLRMTDVDLIVVKASSMDDVPALIFNNFLTVDFKKRESQINVIAEVAKNQLSMTSLARYLESKSLEAIIIPPADFTIAFHMDIESKVKHIDFTFEAIRLGISPNILQVLLSLIRSIASDEQEPPKIEVPIVDTKSLTTPKNFNQSDHWFLKQPFSTALEPMVDPALQNKLDQCIIDIPSVKIILESGGAYSIPLVTLECAVIGKFDGWDYFKINTSLVASYYNEKLHVWEPVIEMIESKRPWTFDTRGTLAVDNRTTRISVESDERLEFTASKTFLSVASKLGESFEKAVNKSESILQPADSVKIINLTGIPVNILAPEFKYELQTYPLIRGEDGLSSNFRSVHIPPGKEQILKCRACFTLNCENAYDDEQNSLEVIFHYKRDSMKNKFALSSEFELLYPIPGEPNYWLVRVESPVVGMKKVTLGTFVEISNNLQQSIQIFQTDGDHEPFLVLTVNANDSSFLPIDVLSNSKFDHLFFSFEEYHLPEKAVSWRERHNLAIFIQCEPKVQPNAAAHMVLLIKQVRAKSAKYVRFVTKIVVQPRLILQNLLPYELEYSHVKREVKFGSEENTTRAKKFFSLPPGESHQLVEFGPLEVFFFKISDYIKMGACKSLPIEINVKHTVCDELYDLLFHVGPENKPLALLIRLFKPSFTDSLIAQIFSPFWFINKTGMQFSYRTAQHRFWTHPAEITDPILFSFFVSKPTSRRKKEKERIQIRYYDSDWSEPFSIDAVGNQGSILCRDEDRIPYFISVDIALSSFSLTKIVTFSPFYNVINRTDTEVEVSDDRANWKRVPPLTKSSFWPQVAKNDEFWLQRGDDLCNAISFKSSNSTLVALANQLINVIVEVANSGITIQLTNYSDGACPVRIFNHTSGPIEFWQDDNASTYSLAPGLSVYYLWDFPKKRRVLCWKSDQMDQVVPLTINEDSWAKTLDKNFSWVSFLDGRQRVLLISHDLQLTQAATRLYELTEPKIEFEIALKSMGLSIVDNENQKDLIYMGIRGMETIWEVEKVCCKNFKLLPKEQMQEIESAYQNTLSRPSQPEKVETLITDVTVDFEKMQIVKPVKGILRRRSSPALWVYFSYSDHIFDAHVKVFRVQVDNQMRNPVFEIIMCPVAPPKSVVRDRTLKPFIEMGLLKQKTTNVNRFKMLNVLIQEFLIQVDAAFLLAMKDFLDQSSAGDELNYKKLLSDDLLLIQQEEIIRDDHEITLSKAYFDYLHFSPIKLHLSFSLSGYPMPIFIRSIFSLTKFKDAVFRIDFFERRNVFLDLQELLSAAKDHYMRQVLTQLYVIVFGFDLIGNPVNLISGIGQAVGKFFYEPFLGIIQGPEEFAQGVVFASESLFSQTIGGTAGALSRITGTLGDGASALTMDRKFQSKRRVRMQRSPNMAVLTKELAVSPFRGISGVVKRPMEGVQKDGCTGLVKGIGKGAVGLVAYPATGVIDFATGSMSAIKKAVDVTKEAKKQRPARFFREDGIIEPYNLHEATGNEILMSLDDGLYAETDLYIAHYFIRKSVKNVEEQLFLITDLQLFALRKSEKSSYYKVVWKERFHNIIRVEIINICIISITIMEFNVIHRRFINCESHETAQVSLSVLYPCA